MLLAAIGLGACAGMDPELTAARESWRGARYDDVVAAWGPPTRTVKSGAQENHTWTTDDSVTRPGGSAGGVGGAIFGGPGAGRCERTLVFRGGRAVDEDWHGEAEFCKRFARRR